MNKKLYSERDICSKIIMPAVLKSGWDLQTQISEEKTLTDGRIIVRGKMVAQGKKKRDDYVLYLDTSNTRLLEALLHEALELRQ